MHGSFLSFLNIIPPPLWYLSDFIRTYLPSNALRYVTPNSMNRLPLDSMIHRLYQGDVVVVDLSVMVHMDAHQRACRQSLRQLSSGRRMPIFALDDKESLLMLPGNNIHVDVSKYDLV